tara:strand:- start:1008 stop:1346 length:339 start_codon:yes stop_codon:yes gene_type:complete
VGVAKAAQKVPVTLVDISDGETLEASVASPTIEISKNGAAYAAASDGTWTEISDGDYTVTLDGTDTDTVGWLLLRVVKATVSMESRVLVLVGLDPAAEVAMWEKIRLIHLGR